MPNTAPPDDRLPTLDGWRAIAILCVIFAHSLPEPVEYAGHWYAGLGIVGVRVFFGISGLVVCYSLARERIATGRIRLGQFYGRRIFRLLPAALTFLATISLFGWLGVIPVTFTEVVACLALYRNYSTSPEYYYTGHFWSLMVEEHFYLLVPVILAVVARRAALVVFPVAAVLIAIWRGLDSRYHWSGLPFTVWRTDLCLDYLFWGAWFGVLLASEGMRKRLAWLGSPFPRWLLTAAMVSLITLPVPVVGFWFALTMPALLVATVQAPDSTHGRILRWRPLVWVGLVSYSLYLWQQLFLMPTAEGAAREPFRAFQNWPVGIPLLFAAAALAYYFIERPLRRRGYRWLASGVNSKKSEKESP